jgi:hypothetical protein
MYVVQKKEMKMFTSTLIGAPQVLYRCLSLLECVKFSIEELPFSEHLQISVDVKLFVHDRVTSTF